MKTKERIVFMLILGGPHVAISLVLVMILEIHVFRRCVFNGLLSQFRWTIMCSGGAQEVTTVEILMQK